MKALLIVLVAAFAFFQYKLWLDPGGVRSVKHLQQAITAQTAENNQLQIQNSALLAEIEDLKNGQAAIEERARNDLGMTKPNEVFYQVVDN